jgi:single-stranded DNA-binding protein
VRAVLNTVILAGPLLRPPGVERPPAGPPVWRFVIQLARAPGAQDPVGPGQWIEVEWRPPAGTGPGAALRAGDCIVVQGRLRVRAYRDRAGRRRVSSIVVAQRVVAGAGASGEAP